MWSICIFALLWAESQQSEIFDLLLKTEQFFDESQAISCNQDVNSFKSMMKRTYELQNIHSINKRFVNEGDSLVQDKRGIYLLSNIEDVAKIPAKFPNDINSISIQNLLFITALESNGTNPEIQLANDLVLYQYSPIHGLKEIGRVPVFGGVSVAVHSFQNATYLITAEHNSNSTLDSFEGSTIYKITEQNGKVILEKIQILNVIQPNDVQFWEHQGQLYLVIGSNMGNESLRTNTLVYRWMGYHFDCIQQIPTKYVKSVVPFTIESYMYLAIANYQDEFGNTDIYSDIYQFHLGDMKFNLLQRIKTHGAQHITHFHFEDVQSKKSEHFLAIANYIGKNSNGALTSFLDSVVYKFDGKLFIPFQSFKLLGATKFLPVQGPKGEFLLLVSHSNGVRGYQYDGWRFSQVSLKFRQSALGDSVSSMRSFQYFEDIFLIIADKNSLGESVNLWKLSFTNQNDLEKQYEEIEGWCEGMKYTMAQDNIIEILDGLKTFDGKTFQEKKLWAEDLKLGEPESLRYEIERLTENIKTFDEIIKSVSESTGNSSYDMEIPVSIGSGEMSHFEIKCNMSECVIFKDLQLSKVNGVDFAEFLENVVSLEEEITDTDLVFEHVVVDQDIIAPLINGHPSETLVDVSSETFINSEFLINGTVKINGDLSLYELLEDFVPNKFLLFEKNQNIDDKLIVDTLKVDNLNLSGLLNGESLDFLVQQLNVQLQNSYKELNVNNMVVHGLINGHNVSELLEDALKNYENHVIEGDLYLPALDADEVFVYSEEISNKTILAFLASTLCSKPLDSRDAESRSSMNELDYFEISDQHIIIVEGLLKAYDVTDTKNSFSLLDIVNNSWKLNESVVDSAFEISNVEAHDVCTETINNMSVLSWVLKDSDEVQRIFGKKKFTQNFHIHEKVIVEKINEIETKEIGFNSLKHSQDVAGDFIFDTITCNEIRTDFANLGEKSFNKLNRLMIKNSVAAEKLLVDDLNLKGEMDDFQWSHIFQDSVFRPSDVVWGEKTLKGRVEIQNLNLSDHINEFLFNEVIKLNSKDSTTFVLDGNVALANFLMVDELLCEGSINSILNPKFYDEWLIQDKTQIVRVPFDFENLELKSGSTLKNETVNNVNLKKLFSSSIKINEETRIKHLYAMDKIKVQRINVGGTINGADFNSVILRSEAQGEQNLSGDWFLESDLTVNGSLIIEGLVSGLNLTHMCDSRAVDKINLSVGGSVKFLREPRINVKVNGIHVSNKCKQIWMRTENTTLTGKNIRFDDVGFHNRTILMGNLNRKNLTQISKYYLSKSSNPVISGNLEFDRIIIQRWCRMRKVKVDGTVNGINITHWSKNVLLQDTEQTIREKLRFSIFETLELNLNGTINGLDLTNDVLRYDSMDAEVEGHKTFQGIKVADLTITKGKKIQGVDINDWADNLVTRQREILFKGNLTFLQAAFNSPMTVSQLVNDIDFDANHIFTTNRNQQVMAFKHFHTPSIGKSSLTLKKLLLEGLIDDLDLGHLLHSQAYSDRDLTFTQPQTFENGLDVDTMEVDGLFQSVNISEMCFDAFHPLDVNELKKGFNGLLDRTRTLTRVIEGRAFFFDHFELIQTLKPDVRAVVPAADIKGKYVAVFTPQTMRFMTWNKHSESFVSTGENLRLKENITFVTSEMSGENSLLYMETSTSGQIFLSEFSQNVEGKDTSCVTFFQLKALNKTCIFIGQKWNSSRILCSSSAISGLHTYQWLESKGSVQATALTIEDEVYLAVINKEEVVDKIENSLTIYRFDLKLQHFHVTYTLAEVNPVALSSIAYQGNYYLVSAGGHLPESVHNSVLSIFRFNKNHKVFVRSQSIQVDTPVDVCFALLPSSELALYVLTSNPTKPFVVFLYRGIASFVEETSGLSLYPGTNLYPFTDSQRQHFVVIRGFGKGQILKAGFKGEKKTDWSDVNN